MENGSEATFFVTVQEGELWQVQVAAGAILGIGMAFGILALY